MKADIKSSFSPQHVAVIMDGNGRWAKNRFLPRLNGHKKAISAVRNTIEGCVEANIPHLTLFAFSSENWQRPKLEVEGLMELLSSTLNQELENFKKNNVKLIVIGEKEKLSNKLQEQIAFVEKQTKNNTGLILNLAISYGGRWDIVNACKQLVSMALTDQIAPDEINEKLFSQYLALANQPDPDLLIRTSGEIRISNFLIWNLAYSELYFTDKLWPDFSKQDLIGAFEFFKSRKRRFGLTEEQL